MRFLFFFSVERKIVFGKAALEKNCAFFLLRENCFKQSSSREKLCERQKNGIVEFYRFEKMVRKMTGCILVRII